MAAYFRRHPAAAANAADVDAFLEEHGGTSKRAKRASYRESVLLEHARHARKGSAYILSVPRQVREVMVRRAQILRGDWATQFIQIL